MDTIKEELILAGLSSDDASVENEWLQLTSAETHDEESDDLTMALAASEQRDSCCSDYEAFGSPGEELGALESWNISAIEGELEAISLEDDIEADQELEMAMSEIEPDESGVDSLIAIAKNNPGLRLTISFSE